MNYSLEWLINLKKEYIKKKSKAPISPSDWDNDDTIKLPELIISKTMEHDQKQHEYAFMYDVSEFKKQYCNFTRNIHNYNIEETEVSISQNSTSAIYLSIKGLIQKGFKRFLVTTPTYFSILDSIQSHLSAEIYFYHLKDYDNFSIDINYLEKVISEQFIDCLFLTDPIFCTSQNIDISLLKQIVATCNKNNTWLVYDYTLGNMYFNRNCDVYDITKLKEVKKTKKHIFIESINKRLFMNGIKTSIIHATSTFIPIIESSSNYVNGGFSSSQLVFFQESYSVENSYYIQEVFDKNRNKVKSNYKLLKSLLLDTEYSIFDLESSYYITIYNKKYNIEAVNIQNVVKNILYNTDVLIIPNCRFSFYKKNKFGFRVNLSKSRDCLLEAISRVVKVNIKTIK